MAVHPAILWRDVPRAERLPFKEARAVTYTDVNWGRRRAGYLDDESVPHCHYAVWGYYGLYAPCWGIPVNGTGACSRHLRKSGLRIIQREDGEWGQKLQRFLDVVNRPSHVKVDRGG